MIRYLDLTFQIWDEEDKEVFEFSWYDTITGKILSFSNENVWSSWEDFESDFQEDLNYDIERFKRLFPKEKMCS